MESIVARSFSEEEILRQIDRENKQRAASIDIDKLFKKHGFRILRVNSNGEVIVDPNNPIHKAWLRD